MGGVGNKLASYAGFCESGNADELRTPLPGQRNRVGPTTVVRKWEYGMK